MLAPKGSTQFSLLCLAFGPAMLLAFCTTFSHVCHHRLWVTADDWKAATPLELSALFTCLCVLLTFTAGYSSTSGRLGRRDAVLMAAEAEAFSWTIPSCCHVFQASIGNRCAWGEVPVSATAQSFPPCECRHGCSLLHSDKSGAPYTWASQRKQHFIIPAREDSGNKASLECCPCSAFFHTCTVLASPSSPLPAPLS